MKLSYSCCPKIKSKVSAHNKKLLFADNVSRGDVCNCRVKADCPMRGEGPCNVGSVVYKATLTDQASSMVKTYIGSSNNFKQRVYRHKESMRNVTMKTDSSLSECFWSCKDNGIYPVIKFEVLKKAPAYTPESKKCLLCTQEKLCIMRALKEDPNTLNKRSELMKKCLHRASFLLSKMDTWGKSIEIDTGWLDTGQRMDIIFEENGHGEQENPTLHLRDDEATVLRNGKILRGNS